MSVQIAVRIPSRDLEALDRAVQRGEFASRAEGVRVALARELAAQSERDLAAQYERAYSAQPPDTKLGEAGAALMAEVLAEREAADGADRSR